MSCLYFGEQRHRSWNRIKSPQISPHLYSQLIFDREIKHLQWAKDSLFNKWCLEYWTGTCQKRKNKKETRPFSYTIRKNKLKWIKDLNVILKTIKLLEENIGNKLSDISFSSNFFWYISPGKGNKKIIIKKWDYIKLKRFYPAKETINEIKRQPTEWKEIFASDKSGKGLISKIDKEFIQHQKHKQSN